MAVHILIWTKAGEHCDACKKPVADPANPMMVISVTSRHQYERNRVWLHWNCFAKRAAVAFESAAGPLPPLTLPPLISITLKGTIWQKPHNKPQTNSNKT